MGRLDLLYQRHNNRRPRGELPPAIVRERPADCFEQCAYEPPFEPRCTNLGTWRVQDRFLHRLPNGELRRPAERYERRCDEHANAMIHEPIPESELE